MLFYYTGWGWLVPVFYCLGIIPVAIIDQTINGNQLLTRSESWPWFVGMFAGCLLIGATGLIINRKGKKHSFYFIRMELWGVIIPILTYIFYFLS